MSLNSSEITYIGELNDRYAGIFPGPKRSMEIHASTKFGNLITSVEMGKMVKIDDKLYVGIEMPCSNSLDYQHIILELFKPDDRAGECKMFTFNEFVDRIMNKEGDK